MKKLYSSPLKVYLVLGFLGFIGIYCGLTLPISLFPNSSKPEIGVTIPYGSMTAEEFLNTHGRNLERQLRGLATEQVSVDELTAEYGTSQIYYEVNFDWGTPPRVALREVESTVNSYSARLAAESRDNLNIWLNDDNSGFFAASYFSDIRDLNELYDILDPIITPRLPQVKDAKDPGLYNPGEREIRIELYPEAMASLQLFPRDIEAALSPFLSSHRAGSITVGTQKMLIEMSRQTVTVDDLSKVSIRTPSGQNVHLSDIARVDYGPKTTGVRSFRTNGAESLILWGTPGPGGNIKRMSEQMIALMKEVQPLLPKDVQFRVLVDPSEFIRASVRNVFNEVVLAALIAVLVLWLFIGSVRNVVTAAIEIPLSMILAFILMKLTGMNLNLISLGGLALSAGMNVDASVVVMENIFRHFEMHHDKKLSYAQRLDIIYNAVKEVRFAVIAATIASLVVFVPLTFTSKLTFAILGDLAKAVVFSHGFSAFVAILLVPTIRLQLMARGDEKRIISPIEVHLKRLEALYTRALRIFLSRASLKVFTYGGLVALLGILLATILPNLPKELVGRPDTDWIILGIRTKGNTLLTQMESQASEIEFRMLQKFGDKIRYTFSNVRGPNRANLMARLKDKSQMREVWKGFESEFVNSPELRFWVIPWNPSELPIPDPEHLRLEVRGGEPEIRAELAREAMDYIRERKIYPTRLWSDPNINRNRGVVVQPFTEQWALLQSGGSRLTMGDLSDFVRVATTGRRVGQLPLKGDLVDIRLTYPQDSIRSMEDVAYLPIGINSKIVPLKALADVKIDRMNPTIYREQEEPLIAILAKLKLGKEDQIKPAQAKAKAAIEEWKSSKKDLQGVGFYFTDPFEELNEALDQLTVAVALSVGLIFFTLLVQFGNLPSTLIVLVSVPLGFIGVLVSLFVFQSNLSLNSALGVILLNGIAVANSIILVDFMLKLVAEGVSPREAALQAARKRLRPILITSLTTILGMFPIALGMGDGGRILQPLGITVSGGLWVSTLLTLFLVPALQCSYLELRQSHGGLLRWMASLRNRPVALPQNTEVPS